MTSRDKDATLYEHDRAVRTAPWDETAFRRVFRHEIATVNGEVRIHHVVGGDGSAPEEVRRLVLLEGLPAGLEPPSASMPMLRGKPMWHPGFGSTPNWSPPNTRDEQHRAPQAERG